MLRMGIAIAGHGVGDIKGTDVSKEMHPSKARSAMPVTDLGMSTCLRAQQSLNTKNSMLVTELGIFTLSSALQDLKAPSSILVTDSGISTCFLRCD